MVKINYFDKWNCIMSYEQNIDDNSWILPHNTCITKHKSFKP